MYRNRLVNTHREVRQGVANRLPLHAGVRHTLATGGVVEEPPHPAQEVRRRLLSRQLGLEPELPELLQRRLHLAHGHLSSIVLSNPLAMPDVGVATRCAAMAHVQ